MSPTLWSGSAAVPGVLQLGRAQLWFGCILYFYCWTLTVMAVISGEWICSVGVIDNLSCPQCPSWQGQQGKDQYQTALLTTATVLGAAGYVLLALRWLPLFARFPFMKLLSVLLLSSVIALDFVAHFSYRSSYASVVDASSGSTDSFFFCTGYSYAEIAAVYGCLTVGLLVWHEAVEWAVRRRMRERRELRRRLRAQQDEQQRVTQHNTVSDTPHNGTKQERLAVSGSEPGNNQSSAVPPFALVPTSLPSFQMSSILIAPSSSHVSSAPSSDPSSIPATRQSFSSSLAEWCERLGLYTRPDTKLDSLLLKWTWKDQLSPMQRRLVVSVNFFFLLLYFGGLIISSLEDWALQDGINYILSSWCTLGYGLYTPITTGGRIFMYFYWPVGFVIISSTSTTIWRVMLARVDRALREATEKLVPNASPNKSRAASPATAQLTDGRLQRNEKERQADTAAAGGDGGSSEDEERSGMRHHTAYPALKDIVFNSPSAKHSLSNQFPPSHTTHHTHERNEHDLTSRANLSSVLDGHTAPVDGRPTNSDIPSDFSVDSLRLSSPARLSTAKSPSRLVQHVDAPRSLTPPSHLPSFPTTSARRERRNAPTASYPLSSGRQHFSLTVYEAARESATLPSLADVFAPLRSPSAATDHRTARSAASQPLSHTAEQTTPEPILQPPLSISSDRPSASPTTSPITPIAASTRAVRGHNGISSAELTTVPSSLRDDFLAHLRQQTSHKQLQRDILRQRSSTAPKPAEHQQDKLPPSQHEAVHVSVPPSSPHSPASSQHSPLPAPNPSLVATAPHPSHPSTRSPSRATAVTVPPPLLREIAPLLVKLGIAVLSVICWVCIAGGVFVWSEERMYGYWDSVWSAFNLLTTISVGSISTPFSIKTSSFFVWYLLLGVGTLAYCFALIAQLAFIAFDKREAAHHQHQRQRSRDVGRPQLTQHALLDGGSTMVGKKRGMGHEDEGFVTHAKELDRLILQLVQKQAAAMESEEDAEQQHQAFMRNPVLVLDGGGMAGEEQVELPLEGVSLLLRYHLAFQAFERERIRINNNRQAKAARRAQQRKSKKAVQRATLEPAVVGTTAGDGVGGNAAMQQNAEPHLEGDENGGEDEDEDEGEEEEQKLAGVGPTDQYFDWSNDTDWIAQAEEESASLEPVDATKPA